MQLLRPVLSATIVITLALGVNIAGMSAASAATLTKGQQLCAETYRAGVSSRAASSAAWGYVITHNYTPGGGSPRAAFFTTAQSAVLMERFTWTTAKNFSSYGVKAEAITSVVGHCG
ncbi:hypothetical protein [Cellulomonas sp. SLBN-39]|uniref:hypothetical protein n=1 Tax=Cellulomonas sp. SLBN-39 TaxID=2768446 RepID=UPI0011537860|nr:hypothetical protein [Cellulomonas sp. SLBN-39]